jgi:hypothetical protein
LALTSPTSGCRSVGIVLSRTNATELVITYKLETIYLVQSVPQGSSLWRNRNLGTHARHAHAFIALIRERFGIFSFLSYFIHVCSNDRYKIAKFQNCSMHSLWRRAYGNSELEAVIIVSKYPKYTVIFLYKLTTCNPMTLNFHAMFVDVDK